MADHSNDPAPADETADEPLPTQELETLMSRPPSWRKRLMQLGLLLLGGVVLLVTFWGAIVPRLPATPAPTPQPTKEPATLLITSDVNYGTVTVNGKKQRRAPPLLVEIHGDAYNITLNAPPFRPKTCQVRLSNVRSGPPGEGACQVTPTGNQLITINGALASPAFEVNMLLTFADLPADQQSQVNALLTQGLTSEQDLTVPAGSYVATSLASSGHITSQRATTPLRASAIVAPIASSNQATGLICAGLICAGYFNLESVPSGHVWSVLVSVALRWRFSQLSGAVVSDVAFPAGSVISFSLAYSETMGWSISLEGTYGLSVVDQITGIYCATGISMLSQLMNTTANWATGTSHDQGARGCEILLDVNGADEGAYLWRFGVLLAADAKARAFLPGLPVAPPEELAAIGG